MNKLFILLAVFVPFLLSAQRYERYYDYQWQSCASAEARFYTVLEKKDSLWERRDYFIHERTLQMIGSYTDTSCKIPEGHFEYYYANKNLQSVGSYKNGRQDGLWFDFYPNQMMQDSIVYVNGNKSGTSIRWHSNGVPMDSAVWNADGSGVEVSWFDNGNPSAAGRFSAGYKQDGRWRYFHKNGKPGSIELYDKGVLIDKNYFDEEGNPVADTTNKDRKAEFAGGINAWQKYLSKHLYFPSQYKFENADKAVVVINATVDEDGNITDVEVDTPLYPAFDDIAIAAVKKSPKWQPAIQHNRRVKYSFRQPVFFLQE